MKVIVSSAGSEIDSQVSPVFGRAPYYLLVDTGDMSAESYSNPATAQSSGAGVEASQFVLEKEPDAVISSNIGPNAYRVLQAAKIPCFNVEKGSVKEAVEAYTRDDLPLLGQANARSHSGMAGGTPSRNTGKGAYRNGEELQQLANRLRDLRGQVAEILEQLNRISEA
ncbi:MAG: dinitrogenase iron-molybdenum cofactor biosynthesis protein [Candidatus Aegiribacteria sp.]|nr:dinitrogenase iron-molybdenum cofactor biosynthesis protein [Candidatus Aegiribacteria sp.]MBD3294854.1 dinitrogenase iron-molybdenum cofactor biosynthesis protein [Candidatus Fermentibacteria bacterium]